MLKQRRRARRDRRKSPHNKIPRSSLLWPANSPWRMLWGSGHDSALLVATGFDHIAFRKMLQAFEPAYLMYTPHSDDGFIRARRSNQGRRRLMRSEDNLGLVFLWCRTR